MQPYFYNYSKVLYNGVLLTDIANRLKVTQFSWLANPLLYYDYDYQEIDTPENIADRYYGDSTLHWIVLLTNNILDPYFDFPLNYRNFVRYLDSKYATEGKIVGLTGSQYAQSTIDPDRGYQKIVSTTDAYSEELISEEIYFVDKTSYYSLQEFSTVVSRSNGEKILYEVKRRYPLVTIFDTEYEKNENKRTIKILKKEYKGTIIQAMNNLLSSTRTNNV